MAHPIKLLGMILCWTILTNFLLMGLQGKTLTPMGLLGRGAFLLIGIWGWKNRLEWEKIRSESFFLRALSRIWGNAVRH